MPPPLSLATGNVPLTLDARADRIIARLTQRLAQAARLRGDDAARAGHDFLVSVLYPDLLPVPPGEPDEAGQR